MAPESRFTVLHYTGSDEDAGGIFTVIRNLAATRRFDCVVGVNPGCEQRRVPPLPWVEFPRLQPETISLRNLMRARSVARAVRRWLAGGADRVFHGHTRAGLLVALWLDWFGVKNVVVNVHCYGRQRWFYRWAAQRLRGRLFWLSPAMRNHYGAPGSDWAQCMPACVTASSVPARSSRGDQLHLAGVGGVLRWKRWELVVEAIAQLTAEERNGVRFVHIGGGDAVYLTELKRLAVARGVADRVEFRGLAESSAALLAESDALVVASHNEPFSVALLEALAAGRPVLAADSGGTVDVIQPGVNGWLFRDSDVGSLVRCLREALSGAVSMEVAAIRRSAIYAEDAAAKWEQVYAAL